MQHTSTFTSTVQRRPGLWLLLALGLLSSCQATQRDFQFLPTPLEIVVRGGSAGPPVARALVSAEQAVRENGQAKLVVRLRIENETRDPLELLADRLLLIGSDLEPFGSPGLEGNPFIGGQQSQTFDLEFPYPAGVPFHAPDLAGINLRFTVRQGAVETTSTATLERGYLPDSNGPDVRWHVGFGQYW